MRSSCGATVLTAPFMDFAFDTLLVVGGTGVRAAAACPETLAFLRDVKPRRIGSICSGAYVLAKAGL